MMGDFEMTPATYAEAGQGASHPGFDAGAASHAWRQVASLTRCQWTCPTEKTSYLYREGCAFKAQAMRKKNSRLSVKFRRALKACSPLQRSSSLICLKPTIGRYFYSNHSAQY
jgi:hypothetical protein